MFKVGDKIQCIDDKMFANIHVGGIYDVIDIGQGHALGKGADVDYRFIIINNDSDTEIEYYESHFKIYLKDLRRKKLERLNHV